MNDRSHRTQSLQVIGIGEALIDCFGERVVLGGAPLNFTVHVHQLLSLVDSCGIMVSRVGRDDLGDQLEEDLQKRGMSTAFIQVDDSHPTGRVHVTLSDSGQPSYVIVDSVAWDHIAFGSDLEGLAAQCGVLCFGTLAQHNPVARETIHHMLRAAPQAMRLYDVNLRQDYYSPAILESSFQQANAVKLNEEELFTVCRALPEMPGIRYADALAL